MNVRICIKEISAQKRTIQVRNSFLQKLLLRSNVLNSTYRKKIFKIIRAVIFEMSHFFKRVIFDIKLAQPVEWCSWLQLCMRDARLGGWKRWNQKPHTLGETCDIPARQVSSQPIVFRALFKSTCPTKEERCLRELHVSTTYTVRGRDRSRVLRNSRLGRFAMVNEGDGRIYQLSRVNREQMRFL